MFEELMKLENQLCFRLYNVSRKMTKAYQPFLDKYNITYPQYIVLLTLFEHETLDFKELGHIVNLQTGTLTPLLQNLEKRGYILRKKNKHDLRKINITLSKEGKNLQQDIVDVPLGLQQKLQVTEEMYQTLVKELDQLSDMLDSI